MSPFDPFPVFLVRHPEAKKNVEDRHGGTGSALTTRGQLQCQQLERFFRERLLNQPAPWLVGHEVSQVAETLGALRVALSTDRVLDERLRGINLGVLAGLSKDEAERRWPEAAQRLEEWRIGERQIDQLSIPGAEDVQGFRTRVASALTEMTQVAKARSVIAILTRSTLIMIVNLVCLREGFDFCSYQPYEFDAAGLTTIHATPSGPAVTLRNGLEHLDSGST